MDEIEYTLHGDDTQYVVITLDPGEAAIAEPGAFMWMDQDIALETIFGDGSSQQSGLVGKLMGAGKRLLTGESLFTTAFENRGRERACIGFAAPHPGKIIPVMLSEVGGELLCQKSSFLVGAKGVSLGMALQRKLTTGLFGGEGFVLQRLKGEGLIFLHAGGMPLVRDLKSGESIKVDTGCIVAYQPSVSVDIEYIGKIRSALFSGEGLFFSTMAGPGRVWLQSLPFGRFAGRVVATATVPSASGRGEEGSVLGVLGGLMDGDNS
jgi:uncharacterized protein (TIGR00266 family)